MNVVFVRTPAGCNTMLRLCHKNDFRGGQRGSDLKKLPPRNWFLVKINNLTPLATANKGIQDYPVSHRHERPYPLSYEDGGCLPLFGITVAAFSGSALMSEILGLSLVKKH